MGTNYYLKPEAPCPTCGHEKEQRHIGKSSAGWCFSLHVYPDENINDLKDWEALWEKSPEIVDEYGVDIPISDMLDTILNRHWPYKGGGTFNYASNHAEPGPNGLARHIIDGRHCVGHGDGTYDLIVGEFS